MAEAGIDHGLAFLDRFTDLKEQRQSWCLGSAFSFKCATQAMVCSSCADGNEDLCVVDAMCKLAREGEVAGIAPADDKWASLLFKRAAQFRLWIDGYEAVMDKLAVSCRTFRAGFAFAARSSVNLSFRSQL